MRWLSIFVAFGALLGPLPVYSEPLVSASGVTLSISEYDAILAAMETADKQLAESSATITRQSQLLEQAARNLTESSKLIGEQERGLKRLWIFCGLLGGALVVDGVAEIVQALKQ